MDKQLSDNLNKYLANLGVAYIKLHNLHWNIIGKDFQTVHQYLEELFNILPGYMDDIAELLKQYDVQPLASMKEYLKVSELQELPSEEIYSSEVLKIVLEDLSLLFKQADAIRTIADQDDLYIVVSKMEDHILDYKKNIWFISAMLK